MKKKYLCLSFLCVLWFILLVIWYDANIYSRAIFSMIANGRSFYKGYFFTLWAAVSFALLAWLRPSKKKSDGKWLVISISAAMLLGLFSHLYLFHSFHIPLHERVVASVGGEISSTSIISIHTLKPVMVPFIRLLHLDKVYQTADPGIPYAVLLPPWFATAGIILLLLTLFLLFQFLVIKSSHEKFSLIVLYIVASFSVFKNLFDGGMFSPELVFYFPVLLMLIYGKIRFNSWEGWWPLLVGFMVGFIATLFQRASPLSFVIQFLLMGSFILLLLLPLLANKLTWGAVSVLVMVLALYYGPWAEELKYLNTPLDIAGEVYILEEFDYAYGYPLFDQGGQLKVYKTPPIDGMAIFDIHRMRKFSPSFRRVRIDGYDCQADQPYPRQGEVLIKDPKELYQISDKTSNMFEVFTLEPCTQDEVCAYRYAALVKGCVPDFGQLAILNHLHEVGFDNFIVRTENAP